ncbi:CehA/McbA family metallohydrolase [Paenibacillus sp. P96]|uniref:CehA/McbA family metallohydrolase n=1 Tax=Paenibacillus zeirhizosphaerae TaxID=2987519 RepID=A0ABT9FTS9_9BACL|nr:CehA/McbA family metallohydrolase [Paenibacillus sp. P96]MDP4098132.1 CehA/McbA family metallohydrolase [Paenibacillus sp. P96]
MKWIPAELHTHTFHSDGSQTLQELAESAARLGLGCIALTDHNTQSGLAEAERVERQTGIRIVPGMEWTTFYGHMLTLGVKEFIDWRSFGPADIHTGIRLVHEQGGIAGLAHPYRIGSPICTGCFWEYGIRDWHDVDFIEVWSTLMPSIKRDSQRAFALWTDLLNQGYRITATSGRDWHGTKPHDPLPAVTYIGLAEADSEDIKEERMIEALRQGRAAVTMGPLLTLSVKTEDDDHQYHMGECIEMQGPGLSVMECFVRLDMEIRREHYKFAGEHFRLVLRSSQGVCSELQIPSETSVYSFVISAEAASQWVRAELFGCLGNAVALIAFTNPVYIQAASVQGAAVQSSRCFES